MTAAVGSFRRDRRTAIVTLASGIGNAALLVALLSISTCREALDEARDYRVVVGVPLLLAVAAIYGLGKGLSRLLAIRRRGRILRSMQELPAARVVNR